MSRKKDVPWIALVLFTHIIEVATHPCCVLDITPNQYCGETQVRILLGTRVFLSFQETCDESNGKLFTSFFHYTLSKLVETETKFFVVRILWYGMVHFI